MNLEDPFYEQNKEELLKAAATAVKSTSNGYYVNLVLPSSVGDPEITMIPLLVEQFEREHIAIRTIRYVDQCGCGGHVVRVYV